MTLNIIDGYRWGAQNFCFLCLVPCVFGMTPTYYLLKYFEVVLNALHRTVVTLSYILNSGPDIIGILYEISYYDDVSF